MLLSTKGRYAVMAIVEVARQSDARPISLGDIASRLELSLAYLEQLFMKLRRKWPCQVDQRAGRRLRAWPRRQRDQHRGSYGGRG